MSLALSSADQFDVSTFNGASALSAFRAEGLLKRLQALDSNVSAVRAHFVHFVATRGALEGQQRKVMEGLLDYGHAAPALDRVDLGPVWWFHGWALSAHGHPKPQTLHTMRVWPMWSAWNAALSFN
jgi:hypothetical protein